MPFLPHSRYLPPANWNPPLVWACHAPRQKCECACHREKAAHEPIDCGCETCPTCHIPVRVHQRTSPA